MHTDLQVHNGSQEGKVPHLEPIFRCWLASCRARHNSGQGVCLLHYSHLFPGGGTANPHWCRFELVQPNPQSTIPKAWNLCFNPWDFVLLKHPKKNLLLALILFCFICFMSLGMWDLLASGAFAWDALDWGVCPKLPWNGLPHSLAEGRGPPVLLGMG
jgi:hypothetical protein